MKKYFVQFTYRREIPVNGGVGDKLLTFEIIDLQLLRENEITSSKGPFLNKEGVLTALSEKGYVHNVDVLTMSPL